MVITMTQLNKEILRDKIHACWIGKNIGGTMGAPYEGKRELLDISGYASEKGEPLPNDDLDLQLIWLCALEEVGPYSLSARDLGEYWVNYIPPHWNEYGIGKANLKGGLLPPLSGEYQNEKWRNSNGAWIRSEIWACVAPGYPEIARRYAFMDACVDHGMGEGTYAEQFTVTLESLAFFAKDIRSIIEQALAAIPEDCRVARSVKLVLEGFDRGDDWKSVRNALVEDSSDLGWFQAPANLGFVTLGLLYGGGDFKKSMILAIDCGDDTDCTGATVGAFLGILYGTQGIPQDWAAYIGDGIKTCAVDSSYWRVRALKSCTILTERVLEMIPVVMKAHDIAVEYTAGDCSLAPQHFIKYQEYKKYQQAHLLERSRYSYDAWESPVMSVRVELNREPVLCVGEELQAELVFINKMPDPHHVNIRLHLPEGVTADAFSGRIYLDHQHPAGDRACIVLRAEKPLPPVCRVIVEAEIPGRPTCALFPITLFG